MCRSLTEQEQLPHHRSVNPAILACFNIDAPSIIVEARFVSGWGPWEATRPILKIVSLLAYYLPHFWECRRLQNARAHDEVAYVNSFQQVQRMLKIFERTMHCQPTVYAPWRHY